MCIWHLRLLLRGFLNHIKPVIVVDVAHSKRKYKGYHACSGVHPCIKQIFSSFWVRREVK